MISFPNPCAPSLPEGLNPNLHDFCGESLPECPSQAARQCLSCGRSKVLGVLQQTEVQDFMRACRKAQSARPCAGILTALTDMLSYCPGCLCKWAANVAAERRFSRFELDISGPAFFRALEDDPTCDVQPDLEVAPALAQVSQRWVSAGSFEGKTRCGVPASRRTRRRYHRRLRHASRIHSAPFDFLIEPLLYEQGAPKAPEEEVYDQVLDDASGGGGPLARGSWGTAV